MHCSICGSWNLRSCNCPERVRVVTKIQESPCMGCTTQVDGKCVFYKSAATSCLGITAGTTYDQIIQTLDSAICSITPSCLTWTDITGFTNNYTTYLPEFQVPQYSSTSRCTVKLRGTITNPNFNSGAPDIVQLPVGVRPLSWRIFPVNVIKLGSPDLIPSVIIITNLGYVTLIGNISFGDEIYFSLDGIEYEVS